MKGFKLYFYNNDNEPILFSSYLRGENKNTITFDENLEENENDQFTLSFSIMENISDNFPSNISLFNFLKIGRKLKLEYEQREGDNYIDLIINSISPVSSSDNIQYNISAVDYARYIFTRNNIGLTFDSMVDIELKKEIFTTNTNNLSLELPYSLIYKMIGETTLDSSILIEDQDFFVKDDESIDVIGSYDTITVQYYPASNLDFTGNLLLKRGGLQIEYVAAEWASLDEYNNSNWFIELHDDGNQKNPINNTFNIELSDSNTYNALVELGNLIESNFIINYKTKTITYYWKNDDSYKNNYQLSPDLNLQELSLDYSGEELYSILFVEGAKDEYDMSVGLTPTLSEGFLHLDWENLPDVEIGNWENKNYYSSLDLTSNDAEEFGDENKLQILNWIPYLDNFIFNIDYFKVNGLLDNDKFDILFDKIFNELRKVNIKFQGLIRKKYAFEDIINRTTNKIENKCELLVGDTDDNDFYEAEDDIEDLFKTESNRVTNTVYSDLSNLSYDTKWIYNDATEEFDIINFLNPVELTFDLNGSTISAKTNSSGYITEYSGIDNDYKITLKSVFNEDATAKNDLVDLNIIEKKKKTTYKDWVIVSSTGTTVFYFGDSLPNVNDFDIGYSLYWANVGRYYEVQELTKYVSTNDSIAVDVTSVLNCTIKYSSSGDSEEYEYFNKIVDYSGFEGLENKLLEYKKRLIELIDQRTQVESDIVALEGEINALPEPITPGSDEEEEKISNEAELAKLEDDLEMYKAACGTWKYDDGFINDTDGTNGYGKYNWIYEKFKTHYDEYISGSTVPDFPETDTVLYRYKEVEEEKNKIWFNIKKDFGEYLLEGYYTNDVESEPINLLKQGEIYHDKYKEPRDSYGITYLDISDIIGEEVNAVAVGDFINIKDYNFELVNQINNQLKVINLSRNLRNASDITISVDRIRPIDQIIEKIIKTSNN